MDGRLLTNVEDLILEALGTTDVEADNFSGMVEDAVSIGKLSLENRKMALAEHEFDAKQVYDQERLDLEKTKADNDAEKNRIEWNKVQLDGARLDFEKEQASKNEALEKAKLRNERILKYCDIGCKIAVVGGLMIICAAGVPLRNEGIIPEKLPFYNQALKIAGKYI